MSSLIKLTRTIHFFRTSHNWASEASPTLGCSIEISRDTYIYICVCLSWAKMRTHNYVAKHAHAQSKFGACGDRSPTEEEEGSGYIWCSPPKQERPWKRKNIEERQKNIVIEIVTVIL